MSCREINQLTGKLTIPDFSTRLGSGRLPLSEFWNFSELIFLFVYEETMAEVGREIRAWVNHVHEPRVYRHVTVSSTS